MHFELVINKLSSIENSLDLINNLKDVWMNGDEHLGSFDIKYYFSNVPKVGALDALWAWLDKQTSMC